MSWRKAASTALLMAMSTAVPATHAKGEPTLVDVRVWVEDGRVHSTECTPAKGPAILRRQLAMAAAAKAIVRWRVGATLSGREQSGNNSFREVIDEDLVGKVGPLRLLNESSEGDQERGVWCVTVVEEASI